MYSENSNGQQEDNDLKFVPLNIREPFKNKDSSWYPAIDTSVPTLSNISNNFIMGLSVPVDNSNLEVRSFRTLDYLPRNEMKMGNPMQQVLDGQFNNSQMLEQQMNNVNPNNNQNNSMNNMNQNNMNSNMMNQNNMNPNMMNQNNMNQNNMNPNNMSNSPNINPMSLQEKQLSDDATFDLQYPSETPGEELFSYNKAEGCKKKDSERENTLNSNLSAVKTVSTINAVSNKVDNNTLVDGYDDANFDYEGFEINLIHMELLRELNEDTTHSDFFRGESYNLLEEIDDIFEIIKNDEDIINIFKAYSMPEPIYNLVINKIIRSTLENTTYKRGE